jgi:peptide deformylase
MPEFDFGAPEIEPNELASRLVETLRTKPAYGISANQCGIKARMFVMGAGEEYVAFFNPRIVSTEGETHMAESCVTFPLLNLHITRPATIHVEYQDWMGTPRTATYNGISARIFQHQLDLLNGVLYTERVKPLALQMAVKKVKKVAQQFHRMNQNMMKQKNGKKHPGHR